MHGAQIISWKQYQSRIPQALEVFALARAQRGHESSGGIAALAQADRHDDRTPAREQTSQRGIGFPEQQSGGKGKARERQMRVNVCRNLQDSWV